MPAKSKSQQRSSFPALVCLQCGAPIIVKARRDLTRKKFCSRSCLGSYTVQRRPTEVLSHFTRMGSSAQSNAKKGRKLSAHPGWKGGKLAAICEFCEKPFFAHSYRKQAGQARFCSQACYYAAGANTVTLTVARQPTAPCVVCGKISMVLPCKVKTQKTCSRACSGIRAIFASRKRQRNKGRTNLEQLLYDGLTAKSIKFEEQKAVSNICVPDFLIAQRVAVFADGAYWHSKPAAVERDARIGKKLTALGFVVLRFSDKEIEQNLPAVLERIIHAQS